MTIRLSYLHGQVRELLTGYGKIDYLFYDFSYEHSDHRKIWGGKGADAWDSEELVALTRELQPGILINDRLGIPGDFVTPEQYQPAKPTEIDGHPVPWEACQTLNGAGATSATTRTTSLLTCSSRCWSTGSPRTAPAAQRGTHRSR